MKSGQTLVEYALILAFISVVAISVLIVLGGNDKQSKLNRHYYIICAINQTYYCNDLPKKDLNDNIVIIPANGSPIIIIIHGEYSIQEANK